MYAKIENGVFIPAPHYLIMGDREIHNPTPETYAEAGFLPVTEAEKPVTPEGEAPKHYAPTYTEQDGRIVQEWVDTEPPAAAPTEEPTVIVRTDPVTEARLTAVEEELTATRLQLDVTHAGTASEPIPYEAGTALKRGLYYSQDGATYRCNRDTGQPVYHALAELVGLYVEVIA